MSEVSTFIKSISFLGFVKNGFYLSLSASQCVCVCVFFFLMESINNFRVLVPVVHHQVNCTVFFPLN